MYSRLGLSLSEMRKNLTKTEHLRQISVIIAKWFHKSCSRSIVPEKMHEDNQTNADLFADCKSVESNLIKFRRMIKPEVPNSNLESSPLCGCNKYTNNIYTKQCKMHQLTFPFVRDDKYRLSYYKELPEYNRDSIESELIDFPDVLDPSVRIKAFQELIKQMEQQMGQEKLRQNTSGPIIWNIIF